MTVMIFDYPKSTYFGRALTKNKIYEHTKPNSKIKDLFVKQIEQIIWRNKLAPETINLKSTDLVPEIQIISITLKLGVIQDEVLYCIDQSITFPIIFELAYEDKIQVVAAFKQQNETGSKRLLVGHYFKSDWVPKTTQRVPLPVALNIEKLYEHLLSPLLPYPARYGESLKIHVARMEQICSKQREIELCETQLTKENQFNKKVLINAELRSLKHELDELTRVK